MNSTNNEQKALQKAVLAAVWKHLRENAFAGAVLTTIIAALMLLGPGGVQAFLELKKHVLYVHPLMWGLTLLVSSFIIGAGAAEVVPWFNRWLIKPTLRFIAHAFGVAIGAVPVIAVVLSVTGGMSVPDRNVLAFVFVVSTIVSILALYTMEVSPPSKVPVKVPVRIFFVFLCAGTLISMVLLARHGEASDSFIPKYVGMLFELFGLVCRALGVTGLD